MKWSYLFLTLLTAVWFCDHAYAASNNPPKINAKTSQETSEFVPVTVSNDTKSLAKPHCPTTGVVAAASSQPVYSNPKMWPAITVYSRDFTPTNVPVIPSYYTCYVRVTYNKNKSEDPQLLVTQKLWPGSTTVQKTKKACPATFSSTENNCQIGSGKDLFPKPSVVPDTTVCLNATNITSFFPKRADDWVYTSGAGQFKVSMFDLPGGGFQRISTPENQNNYVTLPNCPTVIYMVLGSTPILTKVIAKYEVRLHHGIPVYSIGDWNNIYGWCGQHGDRACRYFPEAEWIVTNADVTITNGAKNIIRLAGPSATSFQKLTEVGDPNVLRDAACCKLLYPAEAVMGAPTVSLEIWKGP